MRQYILIAASALFAITASQAEELPPASPENFTTEFEIVDGSGVVKGKFTAPTMSDSYSDPQPLTGRISEIVVTRSCWLLGESDVQVARFEQAVPGKVYNFKDESISTFGYEYSYTARALNEAGEGGYGTYAYVFAGVKPAQPEIVSVTSMDGGQPPLTFTVKASDLDKDGNVLGLPLTELTLKFVADNDAETSGEVGKVNNPEPGQEYTLTFEAQEEMTYNFYLTASCEFGVSESTSYSAYVGADSPGVVSNIVVTPRDGGADITWSAPTTGRHNGWINPALTRYKVERVNGAETILLAEDFSDCNFFDDCEDLTGQTSVKYNITASNEIGEGLPTSSEQVVLGPVAGLPYSENFNKATYYSVEAQNLWTYDPDGWSSNWGVTQYTWSSGGVTGAMGSESVEEGYAYCSHSYSSANTHDRMISAAISLKDATYPVLSFYYVTRADMANRLEAAYRANGEEVSLMDFCIADEVAEKGDLKWVRRIVALPDAVGEDINLVFHAYRGESGEYCNLCIDEILLDDYPPVEVFNSDLSNNLITINWTAPTCSSGMATEYEVILDGGEPQRQSAASVSVVANDDSTHSLSVRAIYGDIPSKYSQTYTFNRTMTGILGIKVDGANSEYYDLTGMRRTSASKGEVLIKRTVGADGSVSIKKVVI